MPLLVIIVIAFLMLAAGMTKNTQQAIDAPVAVAAARAQVEQYQLFMFVATLYMQDYSGGAGSIVWSTLKTARGAPSGAVGGNMPASWRVVVAADKSWVACTDLDERAVGIVQQLAANGGHGLQQVNVSASKFMVVGAPADSGKASQCN